MCTFDQKQIHTYSYIIHSFTQPLEIFPGEKAWEFCDLAVQGSTNSGFHQDFTKRISFEKLLERTFHCYLFNFRLKFACFSFIYRLRNNIFFQFILINYQFVIVIINITYTMVMDHEKDQFFYSSYFIVGTKCPWYVQIYKASLINIKLKCP